MYDKHYSKSSIGNLSQSFYEQMQSWRERELSPHYLALYIDGLQVEVSRNGVCQNECYYIILGLKEDYTRAVIAIETLPTESAKGWTLILQGLKQRNLKSVGLIISDNLKLLTSAVASVFPNTAHQLCIAHLQHNLQTTVSAEDKKILAQDLRALFAPNDSTNTKEKAIQQVQQLKAKWKSCKGLVKALEQNAWQHYFTYLNYNIGIRSMMYTTNWIEHFNRSIRHTLKVRPEILSEESALALISSVAIEEGNKKYSYPIYNFKFEPKLKNPENC